MEARGEVQESQARLTARSFREQAATEIELVDGRDPHLGIHVSAARSPHSQVPSGLERGRFVGMRAAVRATVRSAVRAAVRTHIEVPESRDAARPIGPILLLTFCPQRQMGRHRDNGPPPAQEGLAHEHFPGYVGPCGRSRLRRQAAARQDQDPRRLQAHRRQGADDRLRLHLPQRG